MTVSVVFALINYISVNCVFFKILNKRTVKIGWLFIPFILFSVYAICSFFNLNKVFEILLAFYYYVAAFLSAVCIAKGYAASLASALRGYIFIALVNTVLSGITVNLLGIDGDRVFFAELAVSLFILCVIVVIGYTKLSAKIENTVLWISSGIKNFLLALLAACTVCLTLIFDKEYYFEYFNKWIMFVSAFVALFTLITAVAFPVIITVSSSNVYLKNLNKRYIRQIKAETDYHKSLVSYDYEIRKFRHDYKNTLAATIDLLNNNKTEAALELLQQSETGLKAVVNNNLPFDTGNDIANSLLREKLDKSKDDNINISFEGALPKNFLKAYDICILLGNALDNAIEACRKGERASEKSIKVAAACQGGFAFIKIQNPVYEKVIINNGTVTTNKSDKSMHGFGLPSIRKTAEKYNGNIDLSCENGIFTVDIELELQ